MLVVLGLYEKNEEDEEGMMSVGDYEYQKLFRCGR